MRLRTDYKFALIDEYYTHWNAFDNPDEFYAEIASLDQSVIKYLMSKTSKIIGTKGIVSKVIYILYFYNA